MSKDFQRKLRQLSENVNPSDDFKKRAQVALFQEMMGNSDETWFSNLSVKVDSPSPSMGMRFAFVKKLIGIDNSKKSFFASKIFAFSGFAFAFLLTISSFLIFAFPSSAEEKSYISSQDGVVEIAYNGGDFSRASYEEVLSSGATLRTGQGAFASVVFFEGSVIRMDENTEIKITKLLPHPAVSSLGSVAIELSFGRIWVKDLGRSEDKGLDIYSGDIALFPSSSALDVQRNGNINIIRVFSRSTKLSYRGERGKKTISLIVDSKVEASLSGISEIELVQKNEMSEDWVVKNLKMDAEYVQSFLSKDLKDRISALNNFRENIRLQIIMSDSEKYLNIAQKNFNNALISLYEGNTAEAQVFLLAFSENLDLSIIADSSAKTLIEAELEKDQKRLQFVLPTDSLFLAKEELEKQRKKFSSDPELFEAENSKETLWEAHELSQKNPEKAEEHLEAFRMEIAYAGESSRDSNLKAEILDLKSEELQILADIGSESTEEIEGDIISDVSEISNSLVRPGFPGTEKHETVSNIKDRIDKYDSAVGRKNALRKILKDIPNDSSSLELLKELKKESSDDLDRMIVSKMVEIIHVEQQKALLEAN